MEKYIEDNMKKEIKIPLLCTIFIYFLFAVRLYMVFQRNENWTEGEHSLLLPLDFLGGTIGGISCIYVAKYRVKISKEKIIIKSLFVKKEVNIYEVEKYSYKWNKIYKIYQYTLYIENKKVMFNSHYKNEIEQILNENGAQKIE